MYVYIYMYIYMLFLNKQENVIKKLQVHKKVLSNTKYLAFTSNPSVFSPTSKGGIL